MSEHTLTCENCQTELPARVYEAGTFLYHEPATLSGADLAAKLEMQLRIKAADGRLDGDDFMGRVAITSFLDMTAPATLIAAARHYGSLHGAEGSECDRIAWARWCHEPTPNWQGTSDARPPSCSLPASHEGHHDFEPVIPDFETADV